VHGSPPTYNENCFRASYNYSMFLALLPLKNALKSRELLVLYEGHLLEQEIVKFTGFSIDH
jgi:ATP-dependent DNA helicase DinG